jgi:DNA modification methylase
MTYRLCDGIEFLKSLPDHSVDGIVTDPPWGIRVSESATGHRRPDAIIQGQSNWLSLLRSMTFEGARVLKENGRCLIWLGIRHVGPAIRTIDALEYRWMIFCGYMPPRYMVSLESYFDAILYYARFGDPWPSKVNGKCKPQIYFRASTGKKDTLHPCARPIQKVKQILNDWFVEREYVVDPFAGSDTTGFAARELNLKWDSCEIDPKMYETGIERHCQGLLFEQEV